MKILLVDGDADSRDSVALFLRHLGHEVTECSDGYEALRIFQRSQHSVVIADVKMPRISGIELLKRILASNAATTVILFSGHGNICSAVAALKLGAYDYILKPINVEELAATIEKIEAQYIAGTLPLDVGLPSSNIRQAIHLAYKFHTDRSIPILIEGETGTGKEVIARLIHAGPNMYNGPFIDLNCAAISPSLFESELFGYEGGAFTGGCAKGCQGKFAAAEGGTIFLDEIGEMPLIMQSKLLRAVQEKEFYRVGASKKIKINARIICATNADLSKMVDEGSFRRDLYYRLLGGNIYLAPLRERREDILPLCELFLKQSAAKRNKHFAGITDEACEVLMLYCWPGNVRELKNLMEWIVFMYDDEQVRVNHLGMIHNGRTCYEATPRNAVFGQLPSGSFDLEKHIDDIILSALKMHGGNKTKTAQYLAISRRSLYGRLQKLGI